MLGKTHLSKTRETGIPITLCGKEFDSLGRYENAYDYRDEYATCLPCEEKANQMRTFGDICNITGYSFSPSDPRLNRGRP